MDSTRLFCLGTILALIVGGAGAAQAQAGRGTSAIAARHGWVDDFDKAKAEARRLDKPLMLVLRCGP